MVRGTDFLNCSLFFAEQLLKKSAVFMVINFLSLTVEILFIVDVGQLNLTRLVGAYLLGYRCNS